MLTTSTAHNLCLVEPLETGDHKSNIIASRAGSSADIALNFCKIHLRSHPRTDTSIRLLLAIVFLWCK